MNATIATTKSRGAVPSDASLVAAAKSGDPEAFKLLVERHRPIVLFSAMPLTDTHEDAEDVVQQSFQKAFVHLKQFQGRSSFSTWLIRIARNEALMLRRNERRRRNISMGESSKREKSPLLTEVPDSGPNPEDTYSRQERQRILLSLMSELRPRIRTALRVCDLNERSVRETARILGVSRTAAKSRLSRGRRMLREKFRRFYRTGRMSRRKAL